MEFGGGGRYRVGKGSNEAQKGWCGLTPAARRAYGSRGRAIDKPLQSACRGGHWPSVTGQQIRTGLPSLCTAAAGASPRPTERYRC